MLWKIVGKSTLQVCPAAKKFEKLVRRITFLSVGTVLFMMIFMAAITGYAFYKINLAVTAIREPNLPDLKHLIAQKVKPPVLGKKNWVTLSRQRVEAARRWQEKAGSEAGSIVKRGKADVSKKIGQYSHESVKGWNDTVKKLSEWWGNRDKSRSERGI